MPNALTVVLGPSGERHQQCRESLAVVVGGASYDEGAGLAGQAA
jgi:hypothetical protein